MITTRNLSNTVLQRHKINNANKLLILGGYIGPNPVIDISKSDLNVDIIYGAIRKTANFKEDYHNTYVDITKNTRTKIYYSNTYFHSKIYCWLKDNKPIEILSGSANFSASGLENDYQEFLATLDSSDFNETYEYMQHCIEKSTLASQIQYDDIRIIKPTVINLEINQTQKNELFVLQHKNLDQIISSEPPKIRIFIGDSRRGIPAGGSGLNWGHGEGHVGEDCSYLRLGVKIIKALPALFPNDGINQNVGKGESFRRTRQVAEAVFDDGFAMKLSFEQVGPAAKDGNYYKALTSWPKNNILGRYIRERMGLDEFAKITYQDCLNYGRDSIDIEKTEEGQYYIDFSVPNENR